MNKATWKKPVTVAVTPEQHAWIQQQKVEAAAQERQFNFSQWVRERIDKERTH